MIDHPAAPQKLLSAWRLQLIDISTPSTKTNIVQNHMNLALTGGMIDLAVYLFATLMMTFTARSQFAAFCEAVWAGGASELRGMKGQMDAITCFCFVCLHGERCERVKEDLI